MGCWPPDLSKVGTKHDIAYLQRWLCGPREHHPTGHMPALERTEADIRALAAYLAAQRQERHERVLSRAVRNFVKPLCGRVRR